jgi:S1-C subfamily serine protease
VRGRRLAAIATVMALTALGAAAAPGCDGSGMRGPSTRAVLVALGGSGRPGEIATGFAVGSGRVVTVAHLLEVADGDSMRVRDGSRWLPARVVRRDRRTDLALLGVSGLRAGHVRIGSADGGSARLLVMARDGASGSPDERPAKIRRAIVANMQTPGGDASLRRPALELAARASAGDSGAAVVAPGGEVVGVLFARSRRRAATAYAVDARALRPLLRADREAPIRR